MSTQSGNLAPQDNGYLAIGSGHLPGEVDPETRGGSSGKWCLRMTTNVIRVQKVSNA